MNNTNLPNTKTGNLKYLVIKKKKKFFSYNNTCLYKHNF